MLSSTLLKLSKIMLRSIISFGMQPLSPNLSFKSITLKRRILLYTLSQQLLIHDWNANIGFRWSGKSVIEPTPRTLSRSNGWNISIVSCRCRSKCLMAHPVSRVRPPVPKWSINSDQNDNARWISLKRILENHFSIRKIITIHVFAITGKEPVHRGIQIWARWYENF